MSQDIVSDALNQIMNAKKVEKNEVEIKKISKLLINLFEIMKKNGHIDFRVEGDEKKKAIVQILKLNECRAIKPRYYVGISEIEKYLKRYLPSRNFGTIIISTNKGLMSHEEAESNKLGGALIAYFY